jgi:hypothetical protein
MSDTAIVLLAFFILIFLFAAGISWLVFFHFPRATLSIAKELAGAVKTALGLTPQVTVNQKIVYKQSREILQLAMVDQTFEAERHLKDKWMGSEKQILLRGTYRAKIGFDLQKGFRIDVHRGGLFRRGSIEISLPRAEVLSVEEVDVQKFLASGLINWIKGDEIEEAKKQLTQAAREQSTHLDALEDAERRIENRFNEFLLPKLNRYQIACKVAFFESPPALEQPDERPSLIE